MRYKVSVGNFFRGEYKNFWFYKKAMSYAKKYYNSPYVSIRDNWKKTEQNINWVDTKENVWYCNGEPIRVSELTFYFDGMNINYLLPKSAGSHTEIIDNGNKFKCFAINGWGESMYWFVGKV
jgi:hypothetical protein